MTLEERKGWAAVGLALAAPPLAGIALLPARGHTDNRNVALVMVAVAVAIAMTGRRIAVVAAAVSATVWFDFFYTRPFHSFAITSRDDIVSTFIVLAVAVAVGELAIRSRTNGLAARSRARQLAILHGAGELVSDGAAPDIVLAAAEAKLVELLGLRACHFDRDPFLTTHSRMEPDGEVILGQLRWGVLTMGLPTDGVQLPVRAHGITLGRFVLDSTPGASVALDRRLAAVTLAAEVGAALALDRAGVRRRS